MKRIIVVLLIAIYLLTYFYGYVAHASNDSIDEQRIDKLVEQGMRDYKIPGLSLGIVKGDQVVYLKGYGVADNNGRLVTPQTPFILGSVSKSFTALAIMQLVEQGKIELDVDVQRYLPWLQLDDPAGGRRVAVRDLLNQTSGISTYHGRKILNAGDHSLEDVVRQQSNLKLSKPVGIAFQYSNTNYIILGQMVQSVSGMSYEQYIEERIFLPLSMKNSFSSRSEALANGLASGYQFVFGRMTSTTPKLQKSSIPAGYLISSAEDMTHYLMAQIGGGKYGNAAILSSEGMENMHQSSAVFPYGMGWYTDGPMISHGGDTENFHSDIIIDLESGWGLVVLMNTNDALKTYLYGPVYQQLSYDLQNLVSGGQLFPWGNPAPAQFGNIDLYINTLILMVVLWIVWSVYRLTSKKGKLDRGPVGFALINLATILFYFVIPLVILLQVPRRLVSPWATILNYVPGAGHALLFLPMAFLLIGVIKILMAVLQLRRVR